MDLEMHSYWPPRRDWFSGVLGQRAASGAEENQTEVLALSSESLNVPAELIIIEPLQGGILEREKRCRTDGSILSKPYRSMLPAAEQSLRESMK